MTTESTLIEELQITSPYLEPTQQWYATHGWVALQSRLPQTIGKPLAIGVFSERASYFRAYRWRVIGVPTPAELEEFCRFVTGREPRIRPGFSAYKLEAMD